MGKQSDSALKTGQGQVASHCLFQRRNSAIGSGVTGEKRHASGSAPLTMAVLPSVLRPPACLRARSFEFGTLSTNPNVCQFAEVG